MVSLVEDLLFFYGLDTFLHSVFMLKLLEAMLPPFYPHINQGIYVTVLAALIILIFTSINFLGPKLVGRSEILIVGIKVGILMAFAFLGLFFIKPSLLVISQFPKVTDLLTASALLFLGYQGFGLITNTAKDIKNPKKIFPGLFIQQLSLQY